MKLPIEVLGKPIFGVIPSGFILILEVSVLHVTLVLIEVIQCAHIDVKEGQLRLVQNLNIDIADHLRIHLGHPIQFCFRDPIQIFLHGDHLVNMVHGLSLLMGSHQKLENFLTRN